MTATTPVPTINKADEIERIAHINQMTHVELCRLWRFAEVGNVLLQGACGQRVKERLFDEFGGFNPGISKMIGWDRR